MLVFVLFELTVVVDSVSFSWDLDPCASYVSSSKLIALNICTLYLLVFVFALLRHL